MKKVTATNIFLRALLFAAVIISVICLVGCEKAGSGEDFGRYDKLEIEGYYLKAVNSVENEGTVTETNYLVSTDKESQNVVGTLIARLGEKGRLIGYDAAITTDEGQWVISFSKSKESSGYTESLYTADYSGILSTKWETITLKTEEKERLRSVGTIIYHSNGLEKTYSEYQYITRNGKEFCSCHIDRLYNEDGSLASEKITNYDESGNVKQ